MNMLRYQFLVLCTFLLLLTALSLNAEAAKTPLEWPYGGAVVKKENGGDHVRYKPNVSENGDIEPVVSFMNVEFPMRSSINFYKSEFAKQARVNFRDVTFAKQVCVDFGGATFANNARVAFANAKFTEGVMIVFASTKFSEGAGVDFYSTIFGEGATVFFYYAEVASGAEVNFINAKFDMGSKVDFQLAQFADRSRMGIYACTFNEGSKILCGSANFKGSVRIINDTLNMKPDFENCAFSGQLNIAGTSFNKGLDLRRTNLSKAKILFNDHTDFPLGKMLVEWSQIKKRLYLDDRGGSLLKGKIDELLEKRALSSAEKGELMVLERRFDKERYTRTKIFYHRLRDNYLEQNDRASADAVMFELAEKRAEFLKEPLWILYGWTMGWGYKPVRFLTTVFCVVVLPFAWFWYRRYYYLVLPLVDHSADDVLRSRLAEPERLIEKKRLGLIRSRRFDHASIANDEITYLARLWHVLFFSTSVLLSIRFNKEWIEKRERVFLRWVTTEWLLGIGLYVLFAIMVKSYEFGYVKGLLGF